MERTRRIQNKLYKSKYTIWFELVPHVKQKRLLNKQSKEQGESEKT
jgi:hypothetical protein